MRAVIKVTWEASLRRAWFIPVGARVGGTEKAEGSGM